MNKAELKQDLQTALAWLAVAKAGQPKLSNAQAQQINKFLADMRAKGLNVSC